MRISDWSSDVCSSDPRFERRRRSKVRSIARKKSVSSPSPTQPTVSSTCMNPAPQRFCKTTVSDEPIALLGRQRKSAGRTLSKLFWKPASQNGMPRTSLEKIRRSRSEEHTSELQSLMRISYAVICLRKKTETNQRDQEMATDTELHCIPDDPLCAGNISIRANSRGE